MDKSYNSGFISPVSKITLAMCLSGFGAATTWTGLPYLTVKLTKDTQDFAFLFIINSITTIIAGLYGGYVADRIGYKRVSLACSLLSLCICSLFLFSYKDHYQAEHLYVLGLLLALFSAFATTGIQAWSASLIQKNSGTLSQGLGSRNGLLMIAKGLGFGLGPLLFEQAGIYGLSIENLIFLLQAIIISSTAYKRPSNAKTCDTQQPHRPIQAYKNMLANILTHQNKRLLVYVWILHGIVGFPLIMLCLTKIQEFSGQSAMISIFWLCASLFSAFSNLLISKGYITRFKGERRCFAFFSITTLIALGLIYFIPHVEGTIIGFCLYTLSGPFLYNMLFVCMFTSSTEQEQAKTIGIFMNLSQLSSLICLIALPYMSNGLFTLLLSLTVIARNHLMLRILPNKGSETAPLARNTRGA
jgi:MFS family permease